jgi:transposase
MRDNGLYAQILGVRPPWSVTDVKLDPKKQDVEVIVSVSAAGLKCPECGADCPGYDTRRRTWRHLDTCQYRTLLTAEVPRVTCPTHGVLQIRLPWAEEGSHFTALFEALVIDWLREANASAVARLLRLSWHEVDGIQQRAVDRGLARRKLGEMQELDVDETAFQKRHEYVTVVSDPQTSTVVHVSDDRTKESLEEFFRALTPEQKAAVLSVSMDMCAAYIAATRAHIPDADRKIAFDKFHVAKLLGDAVDKVRRAEHRERMKHGDETLLGTKYLWLQNPDKMSDDKWEGIFRELRTSDLKVARAWSLKETAMALWSYLRRGWAEKGWTRWIAAAIRSRLDPMKRAATTIRNHLWGILNAVRDQVSNATAESLNAKIQKLKKMACGFRNRERFKRAIYFHLGGLQLYPDAVLATHTKP